MSKMPRVHVVDDAPADRDLVEFRQAWEEPCGLHSKREPSFALAADAPPDVHQRTEEKLRQALKDWDVTFNAINDLICLLGRDGTILQCNEGMRKFLDVARDQVVGRKCHEVMHGSGEFLEGCPYREMLASRRRESVELAVNDKFYRVTADPVFDEHGDISGAVHVIRDITEYKCASLVWEERLRFEKLLADLSAAFVNAPSERLDEMLHGSLKVLVEFLGNDRSTLVKFTEDTACVVVTHSYAVAGCEPFPLGPLADDRLPWFIGQFRCGKPVFVRCLPEDLPPEAEEERRYCIARDIKSNVAIPLTASGSVLGALTFAFLKRRCEWPTEIISRLQMIGEVFASALLRKRSDEALRVALAENEALQARLERENLYLREQVVLKHLHGRVTGQSDALKRVLSEAERVAVTDAPVLLLGETGTGKELLAQTIHEVSARKGRPMVIVNCASLPATLIESELFGREAGAYTGAASAQVGRFVVADGSTLFLDEIGEFPVELQAKLLRVLQDGRFERLGSPETVTVNVRIIAATNRDLEQAMRDGKFRADLFHRLNVFPIRVPPLRERPEDIPPLLWAFVETFGRRMGKTIKSVPRKTIEQLQRYSWPGNVRELSNIVERAMILTTGDTLRLELPSVRQSTAAPRMTLKESERAQILHTLHETGWRIRGVHGAAEMLGIKPTTLESRMARLGIRREARNSEIS
jgi:PAS domain S-box-containing protein